MWVMISYGIAVNHFEAYLEQHTTPLLEFAKHLDAAMHSSPNRSCVVQEAGQTSHVVELDGTPYFEPSPEPTTEANAEEIAAINTMRQVAERALLSQSERHTAALLGKIGLFYEKDTDNLPPYSAVYTKGKGGHQERGIANMAITHLIEGDTIEAPPFASSYDVTVTAHNEPTEALSLSIHDGRVADVHYYVSGLPPVDTAAKLTRVCERVFAAEQQKVAQAIIAGNCHDAETLDSNIRELNRNYNRAYPYDKYVPRVIKLLRSWDTSLKDDKRAANAILDMVGPSFYWPSKEEIISVQTALGRT